MADEALPSTHPNVISSGYTEYIIVSSILALFATICVIIRILHRSRVRDLWWDDWTIIGALFFGLSVVVCNVLVALPSLGGAGYPISTYSITQLRVWAKIALTAEVLYNPSVSLSRVSILLFYWRVFNVQGKILVAANVLFFLLGAYPVQAQWTLTMPYTKIDVRAFYISTAVIKALLDVGLICTAQRQLYTLKLGKKDKRLLSGLFAFSAVTIVSTIIRIGLFAVADLNNPTQSFVQSGIWLNVEMFLSIINACLPGIYAFFKTYDRFRFDF
ncbi:hypothetical protein F5Y16DRAFT_416919 [Xylariaceae sp. FL0255]|nr:hypothetical protein F5Y16DRAFT_416919 [Xylariaceae sp. FL0255]